MQGQADQVQAVGRRIVKVRPGSVKAGRWVDKQKEQADTKYKEKPGAGTGSVQEQIKLVTGSQHRTGSSYSGNVIDLTGKDPRPWCSLNSLLGVCARSCTCLHSCTCEWDMDKASAHRNAPFPTPSLPMSPTA